MDSYTSELTEPAGAFEYFQSIGKSAAHSIGKTLSPVKENILAIKDNFTGNVNETRRATTIFGALYNILLSIIDMITSLFQPPGVAQIAFFIFAILFGFIFYSANTSKMGNNNVSQFVGNCMWAWIFLLLILIVINWCIVFFSTKH
jgi:hypothetical protein